MRPGARSGAARSRATRPGRYCSTDCQRIDWRDRGHRKACKKIRNERAEEEKRAEAPTPPSPPKEVFYGPAPRSHADEVRARIAAEHEAARLRREANPEPEPHSERFGSRCPICMEEWDVNDTPFLRVCCCRTICESCMDKTGSEPCPLCRVPCPASDGEYLALLRRHVNNDMPGAISSLAMFYSIGDMGLAKSEKKAAKLYKRAVELGNATAALNLGHLYSQGRGVKQDKKKSLQLYRMAAARGMAAAQYNAALHLRSRGHFEEAFAFCKLAADQGLTGAENNLGMHYMNGVGVTRNLDEARRVFERAAAKGDKLAISNLQIIRNSS